jgi:hypothetical protein
MAVLMGIASLAALLALGWAAVCSMHGPNDGFMAHCVMGGITGLSVLLLAIASVTSMTHRNS